MKLDSYIMQYKKINIKWTEDLNVRAKGIKSLSKHIGILHDTGLSNAVYQVHIKNTYKK